MKRIYKIIRALLLVFLALAILIPTAVYIALSLPGVQNSIRKVAEEQLTELLGADVSISQISIRPFNKATIRDASVTIGGDTILKVDKIGAGADILELVMHKRLVFHYAEVVGLDARVWRDSANAPLNIQPVIDRLSKTEKKEAKEFFARINTVVIRNLSASYDVRSAEETPGRFNPSHIHITNLKADVTIPRLSNDRYDIDVRRFLFEEQSGFKVTDLMCHLDFSKESVSWDNFSVSLPNSYISFSPETIDLDGKPLAQVMNELTLTPEIVDSYVYLPDLKPFAPMLGDFDNTVDISFCSTLSRDTIDISKLTLNDRQGWFDIKIGNALVTDPLDREYMHYEIPSLELSVGGDLMTRLNRAGVLKIKDASRYRALSLKLQSEGGYNAGYCSGDAMLNQGNLDFSLDYSRMRNNSIKLKSEIVSSDVDLATLLNNPDLGQLNAEVNITGVFGKRPESLDIEASVYNFAYKDHVYDMMKATVDYGSDMFSGNVLLHDEHLYVDCDFNGSTAGGEESLAATATIRDFSPYAMNFTKKYPGYDLNAIIDVDLQGRSLRDATGSVELRNIEFIHPTDSCISVKSLTIERQPGLITLNSDKIRGKIEGDIDFATIGNDLRSIALKAFPSLDNGDRPLRLTANNNFDFDFRISEIIKYSDFFKLPVVVIYPMTIKGHVSADKDYADIAIDAPYLRQGKKVIEENRVMLIADGAAHNDSLYVTTKMPSKDGLTKVEFSTGASNDRLNTDIGWKIDRAKLYKGDISLTTNLSNVGSKFPAADIDIHESNIIFNDSIWTIEPSTVNFDGNNIVAVNDLHVNRRNQFVKINGIASPSAEDTLKIDVLNFNLDYLFEALNIDAVMLGGDATGEIYASSLLSKEPHIETEGIDVTDISYNKCHFGNALVKSHWDNDSKAVVIEGNIFQTNGKEAFVGGEIFPMSSSLDLRIVADDTPVQFMQKYMAAFATDVSGRGSGWAHLFGTFHDIDLEGKLYADDLRLKLLATNTYFHATDSIEITPGVIHLDNITIRDPYGHTGKLNGEVRHTYFRDPTFNFTVSDVSEMLVYDESQKDNPDWYGKVYANGNAWVEGKPGIVKVKVEASTAPGSIFTFVLSELEVADEYDFLTFRDSKKESLYVNVEEEDEDMILVNKLKSDQNKKQISGSSDYEIEFLVDITSQSEIDLVMDPVAGDKIKSHGSGNVRMVYKSKDNDVQMFGTYTLEKGTYNFTLQDIIIKDFTIDEGSSISFSGDPLKAKLDIKAFYALNANLSDLDESFLQDKDLNRTNVPVRAILKVTGDIQQPELAFDLAFPTLTSDAYRKVKSIVSTDEMMNRQIIYLLALNRFYTPDYMGSTTKGNELFSVASSTITSQLSNMLGHLSDNWSVSPNLRSDRGDFSDVEVDVALSSRLLNNRLLLNGNFGYRDKALNSNQFIGDFEIQYLLNRTGTIRLKAYSYSNDENYYVRTAATTQGVGVMFKRDFDDIFGFLRRKHPLTPDVPTDSIQAEAEAVKSEE